MDWSCSTSMAQGIASHIMESEASMPVYTVLSIRGKTKASQPGAHMTQINQYI